MALYLSHCHAVDLIFTSIAVSSNDTWFIDNENVEKEKKSKMKAKISKKNYFYKAKGRTSEWNDKTSPMP